DLPPPASDSVLSTCARCNKALTGDDRVLASDRVFCRACYESLRFELRRAVESMSQDVNYPMAVVGAVLGGALGVLLWWGFTVLTNIAFGLVAVAIGFLVGHGAVRFTGGKRPRGLQILATIVAALSFAVASYLVNMTFLNHELARQGSPWRVPFPPADLAMFIRILKAGFDIMDAVFLGIVVWQGWSLPQPPSPDPTAGKGGKEEGPADPAERGRATGAG